MADVDPIVASFCGGAVGVLTCLLIVEKNNSRLQAKQKCIYCKGTGTWVFCMFIGGGEVAGEVIAPKKLSTCLVPYFSWFLLRYSFGCMVGTFYGDI